MSNLGNKIKEFYNKAARDRVVYENIWLKDLRQYKGIYDPDVKSKFDTTRSKSFVRETRTKVRTIDSRVMDLLFPANGDKNWGIEPTPVPSVSPQTEQEILVRIVKVIQESGENRQPTSDELKSGILEYAKVTCDKMSLAIADQLSDLKYRVIIRNVMHSGHLYGTGWLKGPLVDQVMEQHWEMQQDEDGNFAWKLVKKKKNVPYAEFKPIWSIYPDLSVTELDECRFVCERHIMPRHKLLQLATRDDFNGPLIRQYISENPDGQCEYATYENELYNMLDENNSKPRADKRGGYELIEYWGWVAAEDVKELDPEKYEKLKLDDNDDYACSAWVLGQHVVKIALQPIKGVVIPYYAYYFDKDETSLFGEGIASIMRDPQRLVNASVRALIDNAGHCAGPQYEVNMDLLADGEDPSDIGAFKVWLRTGKDADVAGKEVVRVKTIASYTPEFMNMYGLFSKLGDEVTCIPRYLQGDSRVSGAGRTASGLSMLMGQANVGLSDLVKFFDDGITKPFITAMYNWNMQFNEDNSIKGDMQVVARGSTALIAKEIRAQQIQMFLQMTLNAEDMLWVKRGNLLRKWAESTDIGADDAVRSEDEYNTLLQQRQESMQEANAQQQGAGYNQLESIIKQLEGGMEMIVERIANIEELFGNIMQRRQIPQNTGGQ